MLIGIKVKGPHPSSALGNLWCPSPVANGAAWCWALASNHTWAQIGQSCLDRTSTELIGKECFVVWLCGEIHEIGFSWCLIWVSRLPSSSNSGKTAWKSWQIHGSQGFQTRKRKHLCHWMECPYLESKTAYQESPRLNESKRLRDAIQKCCDDSLKYQMVETWNSSSHLRKTAVPPMSLPLRASISFFSSLYAGHSRNCLGIFLQRAAKLSILRAREIQRLCLSLLYHPLQAILESRNCW